MRLYAGKERLLGIALLLAALGIGAWRLDALGWALFLAALIGLGHQHAVFKRFAAWAQSPMRRPPPQAGPWRAPAEALHRTLRRSRRRGKKTLQQLARFRAITAALPDAAVVVDADGGIETFNQAAQEILHLNRRDAGNSLSALLRHPDAVALLKKEAAETTVEIASPFAEGQRLELRRFEMPGGRALILVRDLTQINRLLSMRQDFIANVSHELRTPLTVVVGYLESAQEAELSAAELRLLLDKLNSPTRRMQALVEDLLMLTRLESSPAPRTEDLAPVDMDILLANAEADLRSLARKNHRIRRSATSGIRLLGIEQELHSACTNLLANAIKYSPEGGDIDMRWSADAEGGLLEVSDCGIGIPPEHLLRLTERFYRVDMADSRVRGGTGLGLAIVKHVLKRHNTQLEVESEVGRGSRFICRFPPTQLAGAAPSAIGN